MTLPRLLRGVSADPMGYDRHCDVHGDPAGSRAAADLEIALEQSGLRGRGGGAFPLSVKLAAVRRARGRAVLLVNACEGEPMSAKDRVLLSSAPHLVLDGAFALARASGAAEIVVAVDELNGRAGQALEAALTERPELARARGSVRIVWVPSGYVTGQEAAVVRYVNEGIAKPFTQTARISERGIARRPTLAVNAETTAHVGLIARHGARWFREAGTHEDPGTALITLTGAVRRPAVYEIEQGATLVSLLGAAGGLSEPARAFLVGGYAGGWIDAADAAAVRLSRAGLQTWRTRLGAGIVVALPRRACPVAEVARVADFLANASAGQCGPCVHGLAAIADELDAICAGEAEAGALAQLERWSAMVTGRGACAHPDGTASFVSSAVRVFGDELADHARHGPCDACGAAPVLAVPVRQTTAGAR